MKPLDIVAIKAEVKRGRIEFFVKDGLIYCKHVSSGEIVKVGEV